VKKLSSATKVTGTTLGELALGALSVAVEDDDAPGKDHEEFGGRIAVSEQEVTGGRGPFLAVRPQPRDFAPRTNVPGSSAPPSKVRPSPAWVLKHSSSNYRAQQIR
jgi:hypothetical protein